MPNYGLSTAKGIERTERMAKALELRRQGMGLADIAKELGFKDASGVYYAIQRALKKIIQEPAEAVRKLELERLDKMLLGLWPQATKGQWQAVDRVLSIMERRAKLLGLDAPTKIDITQHIRQVAEEVGIDPDEAVKEAERIVASRR